MKIKLNTSLVPLFSGTYGTIWQDVVSEITQDGTELEVEYDFQEFMKTIAHAYANYEDEILEALGVSFIKSVKFLGTFYSPREYNFSTDSLDFEIEVNKTQLLAELKQLEDNGDFKKWLQDHYSSRSGFISFTPDNYAELLDEIKNEGDHLEQSVSAVIRYLSPEFERMSDCNIEATIYDDYRSNGYGGLKYEVINEIECLECGRRTIHETDIELCDDCMKLFDLDSLWAKHDNDELDALDFNSNKELRETYRKGVKIADGQLELPFIK